MVEKYLDALAVNVLGLQPDGLIIEGVVDQLNTDFALLDWQKRVDVGSVAPSLGRLLGQGIVTAEDPSDPTSEATAGWPGLQHVYTLETTVPYQTIQTYVEDRDAYLGWLNRAGTLPPERLFTPIPLELPGTEFLPEGGQT